MESLKLNTLFSSPSLKQLALSFYYYRQGDQRSLVLFGLNLLFIAVYAAEAILKLLALGRRYLWDPWNVFDLAVLSLAAFDAIFGKGGLSADWYPDLPPPLLLKMVKNDPCPLHRTYKKLSLRAHCVFPFTSTALVLVV